jgi:hypothetical protein
MEDLGSIWRNLGTNKQNVSEKEPTDNDFEVKLNDVQSELYGTIDSLLVRIRALEQQVAELKVDIAEVPSKDFTNAFDLISPEDLLGRKPRPIEPLDEENVTRVKGFVAPPPSKEEVEVSLPDDEDVVLSEADEPSADMFDILNDEDPNHLDASEIITFVESYGGILNQEMKKKEVLRSDISDKDRKIVYSLLEKCGIKTYKANKFRTFFFIREESEGETKYDKYMSQK